MMASLPDKEDNIMKGILFAALFVGVGAAGLYYYERPQVAERDARAAATAVGTAMSQGGTALGNAAQTVGKK